MNEQAKVIHDTIRRSFVDSRVRAQREVARGIYRDAPADKKETVAAVAAGMIALTLWEEGHDVESDVASEMARIML